MSLDSLQIKRAYDPVQKQDGLRILVDRIWPRGVKKADASIDLWLKEIAPSTELRKWFNHDPDKWEAFKDRYILELKKNELIELILQKAIKQTVTLIYSAKDKQHNNAQVLQNFLKSKI
ncbi:MAG: hypothetical protein K0R66_1426 [Gammaproteobacteria bacterium]|jgi:uncharacterized protein YeaO (DUF488 family)|nr:hypothetical protein [Gammaproteobacteria bacterium]